MPVIGVSFRSFEAKTEDRKVSGNVNVNSSPRITNMEKKDVGFGVKDAIGAEFVFETKYEPDVGSIAIKGEVIYQTDRADKILQKWKKDKKIDDEAAVEILNAIFRKSLTVAINFSNELRLPPPIQFPVVQAKQPEQGN